MLILFGTKEQSMGHFVSQQMAVAMITMNMLRPHAWGENSIYPHFSAIISLGFHLLKGPLIFVHM